MILALCTFMAVSAAPTLGQASNGSTLISPCPDLFMYLPLGPDFDRWYGVINVTTDMLPSWPAILIELDEGDGPDWKLLTILETPDNMTTGNSNTRNNDFTEIVYFSVQYDPQKITPRLTSISVHCSEICNINNSDRAITGMSSNSTNVRQPASWCNSDLLHERGGSFIHAVIRILQSPRSTNSRSVEEQRPCGKLVSNILPPMNGITPTLKDQWPWQVALNLYDYKDGLLIVRDYICGGTLITARHVITAAQCVTRKSTGLEEERKPMVFLGKHNLKTSVEGVQQRLVTDIFIHPDYNASTYSRDVAILELDSPLKYSDWIRPACLWPNNEMDLKNVIGKKGLLLSWRFDKENKVTDELSQEEIMMVSKETCKNSHIFFKRFTSEYTYCAGNREETSSCPSIGSGMVFKNGSTWYLRGLLSLSVPRQNQCDPAHYAVFTDLAEFAPWIDSIAFDY